MDMVEKVARELCRLRIGYNRRFEKNPLDEVAIEKAIDYAWKDWEDEAMVAINAIEEFNGARA